MQYSSTSSSASLLCGRFGCLSGQWRKNTPGGELSSKSYLVVECVERYLKCHFVFKAAAWRLDPWCGKAPSQEQRKCLALLKWGHRKNGGSCTWLFLVKQFSGEIKDLNSVVCSGGKVQFNTCRLPSGCLSDVFLHWTISLTDFWSCAAVERHESSICSMSVQALLLSSCSCI